MKEVGHKGKKIDHLRRRNKRKREVDNPEWNAKKVDLWDTFNRSLWINYR